MNSQHLRFLACLLTLGLVCTLALAPAMPVARAAERDRIADLISGTDAGAAPDASDKADGIALLRGAGTGGGDAVESEPNDAYTSATVVADVPFTAIGEISTTGDLDLFEVPSVAAGQRLLAVVIAQGLGSPLDAKLTALDEFHNVLAENDEGSAGVHDPRVDLDVAADGPIYFAVTPATAAAGPGYSYELWVFPYGGSSTLEAEPNDGETNANPTHIPAVVIGAIQSPNDVDSFAVDAPGPSTLVVDVNSAIFGTAVDAEVRVYSPDGYVRIISDNSALTKDPSFNLLLPEAGRYYVRIYNRTGEGSDSPAYAYYISISLQDPTGSPRIDRLKMTPSGALKKVIGSGFAPGSVVELDGLPVQTAAAPRRPGSALRVRPPAEVNIETIVTVTGPTGRRSNAVFIPR